MIDLSTSTDDGDMVDESITYVKTVVNKKRKKETGIPIKKLKKQQIQQEK